MADTRTNQEIKDAVREGYAAAVKATTNEDDACCEPGCCEGGTMVDIEVKKNVLVGNLGYTNDQLKVLPDGAVESAFGCGNPVAFSEVKPGQTVLDIGSGAGIDCILAAEKVGPTGKVIGLDMTPEMITKAEANVKKAGLTNVEFRKGDAEDMPVGDGEVDWVISNCVINLAPDKARVFSEIARILSPGGRLMVSDIVLSGDIPEDVIADLDALVGCVAGAVKEDDYVQHIRDAGLTDIEISSRVSYGLEGDCADDGSCCGGESEVETSSGVGFRDTTTLDKHRQTLEGKVWSVRVSARKA